MRKIISQQPTRDFLMFQLVSLVTVFRWDAETPEGDLGTISNNHYQSHRLDRLQQFLNVVLLVAWRCLAHVPQKATESDQDPRKHNISMSSSPQNRKFSLTSGPSELQNCRGTRLSTIKGLWSNGKLRIENWQTCKCEKPGVASTALTSSLNNLTFSIK